jgi:hypothetical protein
MELIDVWRGWKSFFLAMKTNMATSWAPCCVCVGERIWKAVRLACRPRAPSLSDAVGGLGTLSRLASWSSATSRAAAPRGAPFFFFWGAPWARLPFPPARYLRPHAEERRVQRWITKIWNPVTGALVTSLRLANIFQTRFTGRLSLCRVWAGGCKC